MTFGIIYRAHPSRREYDVCLKNTQTGSNRGTSNPQHTSKFIKLHRHLEISSNFYVRSIELAMLSLQRSNHQQTKIRQSIPSSCFQPHINTHFPHFGLCFGRNWSHPTPTKMLDSPTPPWQGLNCAMALTLLTAGRPRPLKVTGPRHHSAARSARRPGGKRPWHSTTWAAPGTALGWPLRGIHHG